MKNGSSTREVSQNTEDLPTLSKLPLGQKKKDLRSTTVYIVKYASTTF